MKATELQNKFRELQNPTRAKISMRFFKTGKGEYGEGDKFLGITVPQTRKFAKYGKALSLKELESLITSPWHEERLLALIILITRFKQRENEQEVIYHLYLKHLEKNINNWDLIDVSAPHIIGAFLLERKRDDLYTLAASNNLWKKRVAIIATLHFIRHNDMKDTLNLCEIFLNERHDLMHKACGWMLREVGKKDLTSLRKFLTNHTKHMPRTMLRYAIERLPKQERTSWMK